MGSILVALNGTEVWALVVETDEGMRVRFGLDDWQRMNIGQGQRLPVRVANRDEAWLFITNVSEQPPVAWVTMARRIWAAG